MSGRTNKDQLIAVWVLKKLGWSSRRIARLDPPASHHTVSGYFKKACNLIESGKLPILAKSERALKFKPSGNSNDLEYLYGKIHQNPCGGGRRGRKHLYDDEWKDISEQ